MLKKNDRIITVPKILLPAQNIDLFKWATIACDQFTSNPKYWEDVESIVGEAPSTLKITYPEFYLGKIDEAQKVRDIQNEMKRYLDENVFTDHKGMILVEREIDHGVRYGLLAAIDLEDYDYTKTATSWIRATEGTVAERIPPRMRIREGAPLEIPHILVLIDDEEKKLIEPLVAIKDTLPMLYDFELMMGSGHVRGYSLANPEIEKQIMDVIIEGQSDRSIEKKYGPLTERNRIQFAIGDGNHSLATAKAIWEKYKHEWGMDHPARYAMVEIENLHDPVMEFEPIHRGLFKIQEPLTKKLNSVFGNQIKIEEVPSAEALFEKIDATPAGKQSFGVIEHQKYYKVDFLNPPSALCVGSVQHFLDQWEKEKGLAEVDYIHGTTDLLTVAETAGNAAIYLPPVQKGGFFQGIINDGALPRKTFSMGEAHEKRFYIESRKIL